MPNSAGSLGDVPEGSAGAEQQTHSPAGVTKPASRAPPAANTAFCCDCISPIDASFGVTCDHARIFTRSSSVFTVVITFRARLQAPLLPAESPATNGRELETDGDNLAPSEHAVARLPAGSAGAVRTRIAPRAARGSSSWADRREDVRVGVKQRGRGVEA